MDLNQVKRMTANMTGAGVHRIKIVDAEKAMQAMTKEDVRALIKQGAVKVKTIRGTSKVRARKLAIQKKKGRRKGAGKRKGAKKARTPEKKVWMRKIRALRRSLRNMRGDLEDGAYRKLYNMSKGGYFRSKEHMRLYTEEKKLVKK